VAGGDESALRLAARGFGDGWPEVVEAGFDQARTELEEVELGWRLPVWFIVLTEQVDQPRPNALDPEMSLGSCAIRGQLKRIAVVVASP